MAEFKSRPRKVVKLPGGEDPPGDTGKLTLLTGVAFHRGAGAFSSRADKVVEALWIINSTASGRLLLQLTGVKSDPVV